MLQTYRTEVINDSIAIASQSFVSENQSQKLSLFLNISIQFHNLNKKEMKALCCLAMTGLVAVNAQQRQRQKEAVVAGKIRQSQGHGIKRVQLYKLSIVGGQTLKARLFANGRFEFTGCNTFIGKYEIDTPHGLLAFENFTTRTKNQCSTTDTDKLIVQTLEETTSYTDDPNTDILILYNSEKTPIAQLEKDFTPFYKEREKQKARKKAKAEEEEEDQQKVVKKKKGKGKGKKAKAKANANKGKGKRRGRGKGKNAQRAKKAAKNAKAKAKASAKTKAKAKAKAKAKGRTKNGNKNDNRNGNRNGNKNGNKNGNRNGNKNGKKNGNRKEKNPKEQKPKDIKAV